MMGVGDGEGEGVSKVLLIGCPMVKEGEWANRVRAGEQPSERVLVGVWLSLIWARLG